MWLGLNVVSDMCCVFRWCRNCLNIVICCMIECGVNGWWLVLVVVVFC